MPAAAPAGPYPCILAPARTNSHAHPTSRPTPPIGVTAPSQRILVTANRYRLPLNTTMPNTKLMTAPC